LLLQAAQSLSRVLDRIDPLLEDDLLGWMLEALPGEQRRCAKVQ
jgi:hypothetical protein